MGSTRLFHGSVPCRAIRAGFTLVELLLVIVMLSAVVVMVVSALSHARESSNRASCQNNLKHLGMIYRLYASEQRGMFPPVAPYADAQGLPVFAAPDPSSIYPDYVSDLGLFRCPSDKGNDGDGSLVAWRLPDGSIENHLAAAKARGDRLSEDYFLAALLGRSYWYQGYGTYSTDSFYGLLNATAAAPTVGAVIPAGTIVGTSPVNEPITLKNWDVDLPIATKLPWIATLGTGLKPKTAMRLKRGVERLITTDIGNPNADKKAEGEIIVAFDTFGAVVDADTTAGDRSFNHLKQGCNVLYLDGHVRFRKYPSIWFPAIDDKVNVGGLSKAVSCYGLG